MTKLLKIRFVKFEKALVAQQLDVLGDEHFDGTKHVKLDGGFYLCEGLLSLINIATDERIKIDTIYFRNNAERDEYLNKVIKWISEEQFSMRGKIKIGSKCAVSDNMVSWRKRFLLAVLPEDIDKRYITNGRFPGESESWRYARPISGSDNLVIEDDVYTWKMEVAE